MCVTEQQQQQQPGAAVWQSHSTVIVAYRSVRRKSETANGRASESGSYSKVQYFSCCHRKTEIEIEFQTLLHYTKCLQNSGRIFASTLTTAAATLVFCQLCFPQIKACAIYTEKMETEKGSFDEKPSTTSAATATN